MSLFPGTKGNDILAWRGISELIGDIRNRKAKRLTTLSGRDSMLFLKDFKGRLDAEIAFEEGYAAELAEAMEALDAGRTVAELAAVHARCHRLAEEYYRKRGSVIALHALCTFYRDILLRKALILAEDLQEQEGAGRPTAAFCILAGGSIGRREQTFSVDPFLMLMYDDLSSTGTEWFRGYMQRAATLMLEIGLVKDGSAAPLLGAIRTVGRSDWLEKIPEFSRRGNRQELLELISFADLRSISGDGDLAEEMLRTVRCALGYGETPLSAECAGAVHGGSASPITPQLLQGMGKEMAELPTGLNFFSRLRLEKSGLHKGKFELEQHALLPLIANVRMLAAFRGLRETGTIDRIKGLQLRGHLSVELTERLLRAFHEFSRLKINRQLTGGGGRESICYIDPRELTPEEEYRLRNGLEAVTVIEKIAYISFTEQR